MHHEMQVQIAFEASQKSNSIALHEQLATSVVQSTGRAERRIELQPGQTGVAQHLANSGKQTLKRHVEVLKDKTADRARDKHLIEEVAVNLPDK
jgi:hypothetical protein